MDTWNISLPIIKVGLVTFITTAKLKQDTPGHPTVNNPAKTKPLHLGLMLIGLTLGGLLSSNVVIAASQVVYETHKLLAPDGVPGDAFGDSVVIEGDTALVGASDAESVYIYTRTHGFWNLQQKLTTPDPDVKFGFSLAVEGDTALVAALRDSEVDSFSGAVYVYTRNEGLWSLKQKLIGEAGYAEFFGASIAMDGDSALIGTLGNEATTYVYTRTDGTWEQQQRLDGRFVFGIATALDSDTALVGAMREDWPTSSEAHIFTRTDNVWSLQQILKRPFDGLDFGDVFGGSVALDGDTALVGSPGEGTQPGAAYFFSRTDNAWSFQEKLLAADGAESDVYSFGESVSLHGDMALIGSTSDATGTIYLFTRSNNVWSETLKLLPSDSQPFPIRGRNLSMSGTTIIAGSPGHDELGENAGAAYIFDLPTDDEPPITLDVIANPVTNLSTFNITATIDDIATGNSHITGASYTLNGGDAIAMSADDGELDDATENVTATVIGGLETGVYDLCVTGTDAAGHTSDSTCTLLAIYDASAGFVTGGGWFDSPAGADAVNPSVTGKAQFRFVSKYKKGQTAPAGKMRFKFPAGNLDFHSDRYDWLVVNGAKVQIKGTGSINGSGDYGFILTAIDAKRTASTGQDLFRIKIWDMDDDTLVYDNEINVGNIGDLGSAIDRGSIIIHKSNGRLEQLIKHKFNPEQKLGFKQKLKSLLKRIGW